MSKLYKNQTTYTKTFIDAEGKDIELSATVDRESEVHYVKKLNARINTMDLFSIQAEICRSSQDIKLFGNIIALANAHSQLDIKITEFAQLHSVSRDAVNKIIKRMLSTELLLKHKAGHFMLNPYIISGMHGGSKTIEQAQMDWSILTIDNMEPNKQMQLLVDYVKMDFDERLLPKKGKTHDYLISLLKGLQAYGKLTPKQTDSLTDTLFKQRTLLAQSDFKTKISTKYDLIKKEDMTDEQLATFRSKKRPADKLFYWQSISTLSVDQPTLKGK